MFSSPGAHFGWPLLQTAFQLVYLLRMLIFGHVVHKEPFPRSRAYFPWYLCTGIYSFISEFEIACPYSLWITFSSLLISGGVVLNPAYYGMPGHINTMIHEIGHVLGLYHVFKGVDEKDSCDDPCRETTPSMETGDLCADTAPTLKSKVCRDPDPVNDTCGHTSFSGTPFSNYMSYTGKGRKHYSFIRFRDGYQLACAIQRCWEPWNMAARIWVTKS